MLWGRVQVNSFAYGYLVFLAVFIEKTTLSLLNDLGTFVENQSTINVGVYFCTINPVPLIYMSIYLYASKTVTWLL